MRLSRHIGAFVATECNAGTASLIIGRLLATSFSPRNTELSCQRSNKFQPTDSGPSPKASNLQVQPTQICLMRARGRPVLSDCGGCPNPPSGVPRASEPSGALSANLSRTTYSIVEPPRPPRAPKTWQSWQLCFFISPANSDQHARNR